MSTNYDHRPDEQKRQNPPLTDIARALVAMTDLRPAKAEQFIADWLSQRADAALDDSEAYLDLLDRLMSRYVDYLTIEQQAQFVRANLPSVIAQHHFQKCIAALMNASLNDETTELLEEAGAAAELLTSSRLASVLGELAGRVHNP